MEEKEVRDVVWMGGRWMNLLEGGLLLLLLLSVCNDVADVLVVNVASHIWGEGSPQVGHLRDKRKATLFINRERVQKSKNRAVTILSK